MDSDGPMSTPSVTADEEPFEPAALLARLKARLGEGPVVVLPDHLPLSAITLVPDLFQSRGMSEAHVHELARAVTSGRSLEPVTVVRVGTEAILIDGHHRIAAYRRAKVDTPIPVAAFKGTLEEAVLEAGRANSRAKLTMSVQERMDYAWRLVRMGGFSKKQVVEAAVVSDGQVAEMRRVLKVLGDKAFDCDRWWTARRLAKGKAIPDLTDEEQEAYLEQQAMDYARRLSKVFSTKLATNPDMAARVFNIYFGRKLPDLVHCLRDYVPEDDDRDSDF